MEAVVEAVSNKFGPSVLLARADGKDWYKPSKFGPQVDLLSLAKGDKVDFTADGKYIKAIAKTGTAPVSQSQPSSGASSARPAGRVMSGEQKAEIARSVALKAIFDSPVVAKLSEHKDEAQTLSFLRELTDDATGYILTGKFEPPTVQ